MANRPILILEGEGDKQSVPQLIRNVSEYSIFPCPNPIIKQNIGKLSKLGELERFVQYALSRGEGDSVLIILDTDEKCAVESVKNWHPRIAALDPGKKIGICFFVKEFEALFLACLDQLKGRYPDYGWNSDNWDVEADPEHPRGAKEILTKSMAKGRSYKETTDQARFIEALDRDVLHEKSRAFRHFEKTLQWLKDDTSSILYPEI